MSLFGKGLGAFVYVELFFYFSLITIPLAMPLSVLLSSLMTFGKLGENFELTALKSAGISIFRIMRPILTVAVFLSLFMFWFMNVALPWANIKGWSLHVLSWYKELSVLHERWIYREYDFCW